MSVGNIIEKRLAIKAHETRGDEVIKILEIFGGVNTYSHNGNYPNTFKGAYYIYSNNNISFANVTYLKQMGYKIYTLEEFLQDFPFKIGDFVGITKFMKGVIYEIIDMKWSTIDGNVKYKTEQGWFDSKYLYPHKETDKINATEVNITTLNGVDYKNGLIGYEIPNGYEFESVLDNKIVIKKSEPTYPKTYNECCEILGIDPNFNITSMPYSECVSHTYFTRLCRCKSAYWKIIGEQMGLGKPWEPNEENMVVRYGVWPLLFPSKEIYNIFYDNFKDIIENCKEFLQ